MSQIYSRLPSDLIYIKDEYTAFCFNEACALIRARLDKKEVPVFKERESKVNKTTKSYKKPSDFYKAIL